LFSPDYGYFLEIREILDYISEEGCYANGYWYLLAAGPSVGLKRGRGMFSLTFIP